MRPEVTTHTDSTMNSCRIPSTTRITGASRGRWACRLSLLLAGTLGSVALAEEISADARKTRFLETYQKLLTQFPEADALDLAMKIVSDKPLAATAPDPKAATPAAPAPAALATPAAVAPVRLSAAPDFAMVIQTMEATSARLRADGLASLDSVDIARRLKLLKTDPAGVVAATAKPVGKVQKAFVNTLKQQLPDGGKADPDTVETVARAATGAAEATAAAINPVKANERIESDFPRSFFHGGVLSISPYRTKGSVSADGRAIALDRGHSDNRGYIEFQYTYDWALSSLQSSVSPDSGAGASRSKLVRTLAEAVRPWEFLPRNEATDFSLHSGFTFGDSGANGLNDASASTIAGSGDFYVRGGVGRQLIRFGGDRWRFSIAPEVSGGLSTDLSNLEVHPYALAGLKWAIGFRPNVSWKNNQAAVVLRVGYAMSDVPKLTTLNNEVALSVRDGRIEYQSLRGGPALETQLLYPIGDGTSLVAGGRIMEAGGADQWTFNLGLMVSLEKLSGLLGLKNP